MEKVLFTALTKQDLEALVIDCVQVCLKRHSAQQPATREEQPGQAAPPFVSKKEAARLMMCSPSTVDNFARAGKIQRHYLGKSVRFNREQVLALAQKSQSHKQK
jgi:excisionase family DNA binding protein